MSNQFLNSESIFEVIGNYPVVDQFDVLYANLQSGSYVDNYITGSMLIVTPSLGGAGFTYVQGNRGLTFSKLGVDQFTLPSSKLFTTSYDLQPWRERAGTVKNIKIFSDSERFYDSLLPNINEYIKTLGGNIYYNRPVDTAMIVIGRPPSIDVKPGQMVGFNQYFPFESLFSSVNRVKKIDSFIASYEDLSAGGDFSSITQIEPLSSNKMIIAEWNGLGAVFGTTYWIGSSDIITHLDKSDVSKILFGFGDRSTTYVDPSQVGGGSTGSLGLPAKRYNLAFGPYYYFSAGPIIRGWKYGLVDGSPHYTSCVFRRNRFGQFRDMLEQRSYPVSYLDYENSPTRYFGEFETTPVPNPAADKKTNETIEYPVTVTFVKQQTVTIGTSPDEVELLIYSEQNSRNQTWSSNLDTHATSSLPYFDLENTSLGRNRGEIPSSVINPEVVYTTI